MNQERMPSREAIAQARCQPNSWIYEIDGKFGPNDAIPREAIVGAWKADYTGKIVGSFIQNHNYSKARKDANGSGATFQFPWNG